jgi:hypothetical protein
MVEGECSTATNAIPEECNGIDDDCDGVKDNGFPDQDGDGFGDACDPDIDGDGVANAADNCELVSNPPAVPGGPQADFDNDGLGDECDPAVTLPASNPGDMSLVESPASACNAADLFITNATVIDPLTGLPIADYPDSGDLPIANYIDENVDIEFTFASCGKELFGSTPPMLGDAHTLEDDPVLWFPGLYQRLKVDGLYELSVIVGDASMSTFGESSPQWTYKIDGVDQWVTFGSPICLNFGATECN